jgi:hypothetical protein
MGRLSSISSCCCHFAVEDGFRVEVWTAYRAGSSELLEADTGVGVVLLDDDHSDVVTA